ncbi:MAG: VOC family protein [Planctomycetes bacterium]|nr:VOC family protein [Planctomycetota bacterium]
MARVLGVGGIFFKSKDPAKLAGWYAEHLGVPVEAAWNGASLKPDAMPPKGLTVWSPFPADTKYFEPSGQAYMINLVVDDLDGALAQVQAGGAELAGEPQDHEYGRFGWFLDPEGNKVELWEPR